MRQPAWLQAAAAGGWLGLLGVVGAGWAQPAARLTVPYRAASAVPVYTLPAGKGESSRFEVPQVRLASAKLTRLVNHRLLHYALQSADGVDTLARPTQQLQQAARNCCYDVDTRQWQVGQGFTHCYYRVLLNQGGLLSLEITQEFTGAYS